MIAKIKPLKNLPKTRSNTARRHSMMRNLLLDQYRARQGNFLHAVDVDPENREEITQYGDQQIRETTQGTAQTLGRAIRQKLRIKYKGTSRQIVGRFSNTTTKTATKTTKKAVFKRFRQMASVRKRQVEKRAIKGSTRLLVRVGKAAGRAALALIKGIIALISSLPLIIVLLLIIVIAAIIGMFFGFSDSASSDVGAVIESVNAEVDTLITEQVSVLPEGAAYRLEYNGPDDYWTEILAAYAAASYPSDVYGIFTMTPDRTDKLKSTFWNMTNIETVAIPSDDITIYVITITHLSADEFADLQGWGSNQRDYLDSLLINFRDNFTELIPT